MAAAWKARVSPTQKLVLLALADHADAGGECFPSVPMLAEKCSLSERSVQGALRELERAGYFNRTVRRGQATVYQVIDPEKWPVDTPAGFAPHPRSICTPSETDTPANPAPHPRRFFHYNHQGTIKRTIR
jgi:DNA-binding transcriptional MocR family regulator